MAKHVARFEELRRTDTLTAGGKGANLGELTHSGFPVPSGFVITASAYVAAIDHAGCRETLRKGARAVDPARPDEVERTSTALGDLVRSIVIPPEVVDAVVLAYRSLGGAGEPAAVAVRSSATSEDAADASFAGMNATFTNVEGEADLLKRVRDCWASLFRARSLTYRVTKHIIDEPAIAVVVQLMVPSQRAGVMFTVDPSSGDEEHLVIEAAYGQGEVVVSGAVEPDTYVVERDGPRILHVHVGAQTHKIVRGRDGADETITISADERNPRVLDDETVLKIARLGLAVEKHYGEPQDIEWCIADGVVDLVQSRPITTLHSRDEVKPIAGGVSPTALVTGLGACAGTATGIVRVLGSPSESSALLPGEVLVAAMTNPDWMPAIRRAAAVVTDGGGITCHAAIVSRELGVPCVVGARKATTVLRTGDLVTVDGRRGTVTTAKASDRPSDALAVSIGREPHRVGSEHLEHLALGTHLYVNLTIADNVKQVAQLPADGVGLLRA